MFLNFYYSIFSKKIAFVRCFCVNFVKIYVCVCWFVVALTEIYSTLRKYTLSLLFWLYFLKNTLWKSSTFSVDLLTRPSLYYRKKLCMCSSYILYVSRDAVVELDGSRSENEPPRRCSCPCPPLLCSPYSTRDMVYTRTGWSLMAVVFCSTIK